MVALFRKFYAWLGERTFYRWPSPLTELLSGLLVVLLTLAALGLGPLASVLVLGTLISVAYELQLDPNGWSWADVFHREIGILLSASLWRLLSHGSLP